MNPAIDLDDKIRNLLERLDEVTPAPPAWPDLRHNGRSAPSKVVPATAAAIVAVLGVGGLFAVTTRNDDPGLRSPAASQPSPSEPAPRAAAAGDLQEISLDTWIDPSPPGSGERSWSVVDKAQLPTDIELFDESASVLLAPPINDRDATFAGMVDASQYTAALRSNGSVFHLVVTSPAFGPCVALLELSDNDAAATEENSRSSAPAGQSIDLNGARAVSDGSVLCWMVDSGAVAMIASTTSSADDATAAAAAADLARRVSFTQAEQVPTGPINAEPAPPTGDFAGTLNGLPWSATVGLSSSPAMQVSADGRALGGFNNDSPSQPADVATATGHLSLTGVPGAGVIVYGYVAPEVAAVRVTSSDAKTNVLPVLQRETESYLAVPIPDGVIVTALEFVRADGSAVGQADLGPLPRNLQGTYGDIIPIKRTATTTD